MLELITKSCFDIAPCLKKTIVAMVQLYKPPCWWADNPFGKDLFSQRIILARIFLSQIILLARIFSQPGNPFGKDFSQPAILLARIQSLSACWIRKSSTAFHRHPYFFSDQGWFSHLVMIGHGSIPRSLHSWQIFMLSSKMWPIPICWHQTPFPLGPHLALVNFTPSKVNWTFVKSFLTICSLSSPPKDTRKTWYPLALRPSRAARFFAGMCSCTSRQLW